MQAASASIAITNKKGLHARAAAKFVKTVAQFDAKVMVTKVGEAPAVFEENSGHWTVSGSSILGLMMLGAEPGAQLFISATGAQCNEVVEALVRLVNSKFDEGE